MRLFIAICLNDEMKSALRSMQTAMRSCGVRGNYTRPENLHLTLVFIGEYDDPAKVLEVIRSTELRPFELRLSGAGSFRRLWWAGIDGSAALAAYARRLRRALDEAGIPYDRKKFSPHITLIRTPVCRGDMTEAEVLAAVSRPAGAASPACMTVERASLMRSDRGERGMIYTELL